MPCSMWTCGAPCSHPGPPLTISASRQRPGVIINMSWDHVLSGMAGENPVIYSAAKGGIHAFSKSLARDVAPLIRVNVIAPGFIDTAFGDEASAEWRAHVERVTPLGRWGTPEDVAQAAVYLASDAAAFVTGQALLVNGGVGVSDVKEIRRIMANKEPTYTEAQIAEKLATMPGWYYENGWIRRVYKTDGWQATLMLVNTVGYIAEAAYHHPDLTVTWAKLTVKLQTHSAGGITDKDFELAKKIEEVVLWRPVTGFPGPRGNAEQVGAQRRTEVGVEAAPPGFSSSRASSPSRRFAGCWRSRSCRSRGTWPSCASPSRR